MRKCCCCIPLRASCIIIGVVYLIVDAAILAWGVMGVTGKLDDPLPDEIVSSVFSNDGEKVKIALYVAVGLAGMSALCNLLLIDGAARYRRCGLLLWLLWTGLLLFLGTVGLFVVMALCIWTLVDEAGAEEQLGWHPDNTAQIINLAVLTEDHQKAVKDNATIATMITCSIGLLVCSIFWGWYSAVDAYYRRLKHSDYNDKSYVHSSHL